MALANMTQDQTNEHNREHCEHIAEELEKYIRGEMYRCPECGSACEVEEAENEDGETIYKCSCGCVSEYEPEELGLYDWAENVLDIEYRVSGRRAEDLRSVQIMVTCGGPNIYIDTATKHVELYWWGDRASYPISYDAAEALDEWAAEYWGCM